LWPLFLSGPRVRCPWGRKGNRENGDRSAFYFGSGISYPAVSSPGESSKYACPRILTNNQQKTAKSHENACHHERHLSGIALKVYNLIWRLSKKSKSGVYHEPANRRIDRGYGQ
jgi:hypothetical protein